MAPRGVAAFLLALTVMCGCTGGGSRAAAQLADNAAPIIDDISRGLRPEVGITANEAARARKKVEQIVSPYVAGVSAEDARDTTRGACAANDLVETGHAQTVSEAVQLARYKFNPNLGERVKGLAKDLQKAKTYGDAAAKTAVFALCESVNLR